MSTAQHSRMRSQRGARIVTGDVDVLAFDPAARDHDRDTGQRSLHVRHSPRPPSDGCDALVLALVERSLDWIAPAASWWLGSVL
jgi:hypothetical protein